MSITDVILIITATLTALMAGLFYAWSCSVMLGFARLPDREFISAMQSTNRAIQNPIFFIAFFGSPIFLPLSVFLHYGQPLSFLVGLIVPYGFNSSRLCRENKEKRLFPIQFLAALPREKFNSS